MAVTAVSAWAWDSLRQVRRLTLCGATSSMLAGPAPPEPLHSHRVFLAFHISVSFSSTVLLEVANSASLSRSTACASSVRPTSRSRTDRLFSDVARSGRNASGRRPCSGRRPARPGPPPPAPAAPAPVTHPPPSRQPRAGYSPSPAVSSARTAPVAAASPTHGSATPHPRLRNGPAARSHRRFPRRIDRIWGADRGNARDSKRPRPHRTPRPRLEPPDSMRGSIRRPAAGIA
jgi:hypothetical protein